MANAPNPVTEGSLLVAECDKLSGFLKQYANLALVGTQGNPPRKYEIEFRLRAYVPDEDSVKVSRNHRVLLTLPQGYPEQPPRVEAITPLYHPALDEHDDSFAIAGQWSTTSSLPNLVLHIADLLTGRVYKMDKPVNPDAVDWYEEHKKELPLDTVVKVNKEQENLLGMLEEDDFNPAFNLEEDIPTDDPEKYDAQIQEIRLLLEQNQVYLLSLRLNELPPSLWFPERNTVEEKIKEAEQETRQLFAQAKKLEDQGNYGKAVEYASAILERIPDHPDAKALLQRLQQSSFITDSLDDALQEQERLATKGAAPKFGQTSGAGGVAEESKPPKIKTALLPDDFPIKRIIAGIVAAFAALWIFTLTLNDQSVLDRIENGINYAETQAAAKQYAAAKETLERTKGNIPQLTIFFFKKGDLTKKIDAMLKEPVLVEGAKGNVLYNGKYVDSNKATALKKIATYEQQAEEHLQAGRHKEAIADYQRAQAIIDYYPLPEEEKRLDLLVRKLEVATLLAEAEVAEKKLNWDNAWEFYRKADELLQGKKDVLATQMAPVVQQRRNGFKVRQSLGQATQAMERNRLEAAQGYLSQAKQLIATLPDISREDKLRAEATQVQLQMYNILPKAKKAFERRQWQDAARLYQQALALVSETPAEVQANLGDFLKGVTLAKDLALVNQALREAGAAESRRDPATAARLKNEALARLNKDGYNDDPAVKALKARILGQLAQHKVDAGLQRNAKALEVRGAAYFRQAYPTFKEGDLSSPKASFLRKEGSRQIYELSSMASSGGGRASKLVLYFAFDERTGQWSSYKQ